MKKIIQIEAMCNETERELYALTEDGKVYVREYNQRSLGKKQKCYWEELPEEELY